ncbi:MAG: ArsC family reductase [Sediminibacterium sp.]|nr:ArsC family reductase [Sediminibacterium sp.]MBP6144586.1 ArsC family reductase [Sediminibacterium sp.]
MGDYIIYAIPNCNTVKKALDWLKANKINYTFHDYKKQGITNKELTNWCKQIGWEALINKKGTTWKLLGPELQATITNQKNAVALMTEKTSVIRRPLIEKEGHIIALGFDEAEYKKVFK